MSIELLDGKTFKLGKTDSTCEDIFPEVAILKDGNISRVTFDYLKISESLERETTLDPKQIEDVTTETCRAILLMNPPFVTAPMIREIACVVMMKGGLFRQRFEYTRIGLPRADLEQIFDDPDFDKMLSAHIRAEYMAVSMQIGQGKRESE